MKRAEKAQRAKLLILINLPKIGNHQRKSLYTSGFFGIFLQNTSGILTFPKESGIIVSQKNKTQFPTARSAFKGRGNTVKIRSNSHCRDF